MFSFFFAKAPVNWPQHQENADINTKLKLKFWQLASAFSGSFECEFFDFDFIYVVANFWRKVSWKVLQEFIKICHSLFLIM